MSYRIAPLAIDDGEMNVHVWQPASGAGPGIVLIQEIFGVEDYIRDVGQRLADVGYTVAAPDLFWRFAPGFETTQDEAGLQQAFAVSQSLDFEQAVSDIVATMILLSEGDEATNPVGVLGFCLGGSLAFATAIESQPAVCVAYYGSRVEAMIDRIDEVDCPTLFQYGNDDDFIGADHIEAVNQAIAGRPGFVLNVENAGHAFDNHTREMFYQQEAAQSAWAKTMAFLNEHLHPPQPQPRKFEPTQRWTPQV